MTTPLLFHHQITDKELKSLIRTKCKMALPYAGAFLKRDDRYSLVVD